MTCFTNTKPSLTSVFAKGNKIIIVDADRQLFDVDRYQINRFFDRPGSAVIDSLMTSPVSSLLSPTIHTRPGDDDPAPFAVSLRTREHVSQISEVLHHRDGDVQAVEGDAERLSQQEVPFQRFLRHRDMELLEAQESQQEIRICKDRYGFVKGLASFDMVKVKIV